MDVNFRIRKPNAALMGTTMRLLVVAENEKARIVLHRIFGSDEFEVTVVASAVARRRLRTSTFDAIVVAAPLAGLAPADVCAAVRRATSLPLLALIGRRTARERVAVLRAGADDVISAPCARDELVERVRALVRRSEIERRGSRVIRGETSSSISSGRTFGSAMRPCI